MNQVKVALLQMPVRKDKKTNIETAAEYVRRAARQRAQIVVLPEMFCCPYENKSFVENAEPKGDFIWKSLSDMARMNQVFLIGGSMPEQEGEKIYNTCFIFDRKGQQIGRHRKVHLFDINIRGGQSFRESDTFTPGDQITVIDTEYGRIGVEICFDIRFTEMTHLMALKGAEMIFVPAAFNMTTGPAHWQLHFRARALDSQIYLFGCSPARDLQASYHAFGHSMIASPWGDVVAELDEKPGILIRDIDQDQVDSVREQLPILSARRTDLYSLKEKTEQ
jgi:omega-amidase